MQIKTNGYYLSQPIHWEDWHAGLKFEGNNYILIKFDANKCFFDSVDDLSKVNIKNILNKENYGFYKVERSLLEIRYNPNTEFELIRYFQILSSEILLDEHLKEYRFIELDI